MSGRAVNRQPVKTSVDRGVLKSRELGSGPNSQRHVGTCIFVHLIGSLNQVFASNIESSDIPVVSSGLEASFP